MFEYLMLFVYILCVYAVPSTKFAHFVDFTFMRNQVDFFSKSTSVPLIEPEPSSLRSFGVNL